MARERKTTPQPGSVPAVENHKASANPGLAEQERDLYRGVFDATPVPIFLVDVQTMAILDANRAALRFYGYSRPEMLARTVFDLAVLPRAELKELVRRVAQGDFNHNQLQHRLADGQLRDVELYLSTHETGGGKVNIVTVLDVTERKRAVSAREEMLARYNALFTHLPISDTLFRLVLDDQDQVCDWIVEDYNPVALADHGFTRETIIGRSCLEVFGRELMEPLLADSNRVRSSGQPLLEERYWARNHKTYLMAQFLLSPELYSVLSVDITAAKQAEQALQRAKAEFDLIAGTIPEMYFINEYADLEKSYLSPAFERIYEFKSGSLSDNLAVFAERIPEEDQFKLYQASQRELAGEEAEVEFRYRLPDGRLKWIHTRSFPVRDAAGVLIRTVGVTRDISDLKLAGIALEEREAAVRRILDAVPGLVWSGGADGSVDFLNRAWLDYSGLTEEEALGFGWTRILEPADAERNVALWTEAARGKAVFENMLRLRRRDGQYRWFQARAVPVLDEVGRLQKWYGLNVDIHRQVEAEEALKAEGVALEQRVQERTADLQASQQRLERALLARQDFLSTVSHELRTPLTGILGLSQALRLGNHGDLNERQDRALETVETSGRRLLSLVNDMLDITALQSGAVMLEERDFPLDPLCTRALEGVAGLAQARGLQTRFRSPQPVLVRSDEAWLRKVLDHLLSNAVKFTPAGGEVGIEVAADAQAGEVSLAVWDTGIGIPRSEVPRLFEPFVQLDSSLARKHDGSGLGLPLVQEAVKLMGGRVEVQSAEGKGSRFTVVLPWQEGA